MLRRLLYALRRPLYALPAVLRAELRAVWHSLLIATRCFRSGVAEWQRLQEWVGPGDVAIDVGANVGYYTARLPELVGATGHVVAIEPLHESFCALTRNSQRFRHQNVTLLNVAMSDTHRFRRMSAPPDEPGHARIDEHGARPCLTMLIDSLAIPGPVRLIKIDVEGHELQVLHGMEELLRRDRPVIILESQRAATEFLVSRNYALSADRGRCSPNVVATPLSPPIRAGHGRAGAERPPVTTQGVTTAIAALHPPQAPKARRRQVR